MSSALRVALDKIKMVKQDLCGAKETGCLIFQYFSMKGYLQHDIHHISLLSRIIIANKLIYFILFGINCNHAQKKSSCCDKSCDSHQS